jgi:CheY-like chemotaxis protein
MLTKLGVGAVDICSSGAAALEMLQEGEQLPPAQRFNMMLSDVFMPDMSVSNWLLLVFLNMLLALRIACVIMTVLFHKLACVALMCFVPIDCSCYCTVTRTQELTNSMYCSLLLLLLLLLLLQGLELARAITALELSITPYVIGLTADTSQETTAKCLEAGMCDVLHKV